MAVINLESLVLRGVPELGDVVADVTRLGSKPVFGQALVQPLYPRHRSFRHPQAGDHALAILLGGEEVAQDARL